MTRKIVGGGAGPDKCDILEAERRAFQRTVINCAESCCLVKEGEA